MMQLLGAKFTSVTFPFEGSNGPIFFCSLAAGAVEYLQQQSIVHRDMKLDNIFMHDNQVKLGDFGLAAKLQEGEKKQFVTQEIDGRFFTDHSSCCL
jgi:serine/threonine protein kinase